MHTWSYIHTQREREHDYISRSVWGDYREAVEEENDSK
jgi:hypothetical protein